MSTERPQDIFGELDAISRPNHITVSHERAHELQQLLDEFEGTMRERLELAALIVEDLDKDCNHMHSPIAIDGQVIVGRYRFEDIDFQQKAISSIHMADAIADDIRATSLGYSLVQKSDEEGNQRLVICHLARTPVIPTISIPRAGTIYQDNFLYIPVDGTAEVRDLNPSDDINLPFLDYYLADVLRDIDVAVLNGDNTTDILQALSKVDLSQLPHAITYQEVREELLKYLDHITDLDNTTTHKLSGIKEFVIETDETYRHHTIDTTYSGPGEIEGFCFYPTEDNTPRLALATHLTFHDPVANRAVVRRTFVPLSEQLQLSRYKPIDMSA